MIPQKSKLYKSILEFLDDGEYHTVADVTDKMAKHFRLTKAELKELTPVAKCPKFDVNVRWAISDLRQAVMLENKIGKRGIFKITLRGSKAIRSHPTSINTTYLEQFSEYAEWRKNTSNVKKINKQIRKKPLTKKFGLISYIDALGTQEMYKDLDSQKIPDVWNEFITKFKNLLYLTFKDNTTKITFNSFSDTLIITLENSNTDYLLKKFSFAVWKAIVNSIEIDIPIRGCFAIGEFFNKENFFIGESISEAAQYYDLPQWIGISAAPSANVKIKALSKKDSSIFNYYYKCSIPLKHSIEQEAWAVNWPALNNAMNIVDEKKESSTSILNIIDRKLEKIKNIDAALKWRNTKKFYEDAMNYGND